MDEINVKSLILRDLLA